MKSLALSFVLVCVLFTGPRCVKSSICTPNPASSELATIQAFASTNGITTTAHSSGLHYEIINQGSGATATSNSIIYITYIGEFLDGVPFDQQSNYASTGWKLNELIEGWIVGIPLIQEGGRIKLIVPSSMAYGCRGYAGIPGNTVLYFDITLVDVQ